MFLLNSCLSLFSAACSRRHPFSLSYGAILPSSLATVLSLTSGFSPCPPVSVLVRAAYALPEAFPGSRHHVLHYSPKISLTYHALALWLPDLPDNQPLRFALNPLRGSHYPSPSLLRSIYGCRNLSPAFHPLRLSASR